MLDDECKDQVDSQMDLSVPQIPGMLRPSDQLSRSES